MEGVGWLPSTGCQSAVQARRIDHRRGEYFFRAKLAAGLGATDIDPVGGVAEVRGLAPVDRNAALGGSVRAESDAGYPDPRQIR